MQQEKNAQKNRTKPVHQEPGFVKTGSSVPPYGRPPYQPKLQVALLKLGTLFKLSWNEENLEKNNQWERAWCPLLGGFPLACRFLLQHILAAHVQVAFNLSMY